MIEKNVGELGVEWTDAAQTHVDRDARIDFGRVATGKTAQLKVVVKNLGLGAISLESLEKLEGDAAFTLALPEARSIGKSGSLELEAAFAPTAAGATSAKFRLTASNTDDGASTALITLVAEGVDAPCMVPMGLDFGGVQVNDSAALQLEVENPTDTAREAAIRSPMGSGASGYGVDLHVLQVPAHGKASALVSFKPTEVRRYTGTVAVRAGPDCPDYPVSLLGDGVDQVLSWAPSPLDLGYVPLSASASKVLTFTSLAAVPVTISNLRSANVAFSVSASSLTIPARGTADVTVTFAPRTLGPSHGQLAFDSTLAKQPSGTIAVDGYGGGPDIDARPTTVSFGRVAYFAGTPTTQTRRITVANLGTVAPTAAGNLHFTGPRVEIAPAADGGTLAAELGVGLDPATPYDDATGLPAVAGQNRVDVLVSLTPSSTGHKEATVTIHSNDFDEPAVTVKVLADVIEVPPCNYRVMPTTVDFGVVSPPASRDQSFTVVNLGTSSGDVCLVSLLELRAGSAAEFSLPGGAIDQSELQPGQSMTVRVRAWPQGARSSLTPVTGDVDFFVSSPTAPRGHVALSASVGPSCLVLSPDEAQFGTVKVGCGSPQRTFNLYNTCGSAVTLQSLAVVAGAPELALSATPAIPTGGLTVPPGGAPVSFAVRYSPTDLGPDEGQLAVVVTVAGNNETHLVRLSGAGDSVGHNLDAFRQGAEAKADILLAIDGSCSMGNKQMALATNTAAFFQYAQMQGIDYHVGVIKAQGSGSNTTVGYLTSGPAHPDKVLTPRSVNVAAQFAAKVQAIGAAGGNEQCFGPVLEALSAPLVTAENAGFLRPDASLAIICITDDKDYSTGTVPFYYSALANVKGAARLSLLSVNAIAGFNDTSCLGGNPDDGRYSQMVTLTGGVKEEICTPNWAMTLQSIARAAFGTRGTFFLTAVPDTSTVPLVVKIDGTVQPSMQGTATVWVYDSTTNAVVFDQLHQPAAGSLIEVGYDVECQ
ncbi:MAG: choice-of-anchor D domain-containing protein [Archangiaceae bacterium]|nr:choice-of-anchor D domain-containing protein [Archangiaceae bacterium]